MISAMRVVSDRIQADSGGRSSLLKATALADLLIDEPEPRVIEIGVYRGRLMLILAALMKKLGRGEVIGIDPYSAQEAALHDDHGLSIELQQRMDSRDWDALHESVLAAIDEFDLGEHARLLRGTSRQATTAFQLASVDMVHVAGSRDPACVERDVQLYLPKLKHGGYLVLGDASWTSIEPTRAWLAEQHELVLSVFEDGESSDDFAVFKLTGGEVNEFTRMVSDFSLPTRDPHQRRPVLDEVSAFHLPRFHRSRSRSRRRLAFLDSTFPWAGSGFRYDEARAMLALRPDTLFFSLWELIDPFPVRVNPISRFPSIARDAGITDAYGVFQIWLAGLCGLPQTDPADPNPMQGPDLERVFRSQGIRLHGTIYPGGGFTSTERAVAEVNAMVPRLQTTFSDVPELIDRVPGITPTLAACTRTEFYRRDDSRWAEVDPLVCLFAADRPPRKGLSVTIAAFSQLPADRFHLHVVGPHWHLRNQLPEDVATFHGWCTAEELRTLHKRAHVFLSPVSREPPGPVGSFEGVIDCFPTQTARDAMSSGCLLVSGNPIHDHRALEPGVHYIEIPSDSRELRAQLVVLARDVQRMRQIAGAGSSRVRECFDVRAGTAFKLEKMGLT